LLQLLIVLFQDFRIYIYGGDYIVIPLHACSCHSPAFVCLTYVFTVPELDSLHHLSKHTVTHDPPKGTVSVSSVEGLYHQFIQFLDTAGRKHYHPVIAVSSSFGGLKIIALGGQDAAKARARSYYIDN